MILFLFIGKVQSNSQPIVITGPIESSCYTGSNYPNFLNGSSTPSLFLMGGSNPTYVRLYIHILREYDGTGGRTVEDVLDGLDYLYDAFSPHNIFFRVECIDYIDDFYLYRCGFTSCLSGITGLCAPSSYCIFDSYPLHEDGIDIFVQSNVSNPYFQNGGMASDIPGSALVLGGTRPILDEVTGNTIMVDVLKSHIFSHEMGHCLGLFHTHHGTVFEIGGDPGCPEIVNQPTNPSDPYYNNCILCGDYVCDTEPGVIIVDTNPNCVDLYAVGAPWGTNGFLDILGTPFPYTQLDNIMSYVETICMSTLTPGQGLRSREYLNTHPVLTPMVIDPAVEGNFNVFIDGTITGQTTWNVPTQVSGTITIPAGAELIIENTTVDFIGRFSGIVVKEGGILRVNNSVLQPLQCDYMPDYWQGILIEGNTNKAHPTNYYTNGSPHHGVAIVENSLIRDAYTALHAYDLVDVPGSTMGGGIVYTRFTQFVNNRVSIQLDRFRGEPGGPKYYQKSIIEDNTFYNNDASWFHIAQNPFTHITLNTAGPGLAIRQNNFVAQNALPLQDKGTGIRTVNTHLNILNNQFRNILHGIDAYNLPSINRSLTVNGNTFYTTHRCLSMSGGVLATIAQNNFFDIQAGTQDLNGYGIFADAVWGYDISANTFTCISDNNTNPYNLGIVARNGTNQASTILDNYFGGSFGIANLFAGQNSRLIVDCNVYDNNINNDWVINGFLNDQGECITGNPLLARRNTFHTPIPGTNSYNIDATDYLNPTDPTYLFQYVGQPGFNPTSVIGNIQVNELCPLAPVNFENSQCSLDPDACGACNADCWRMLLDQTTDESKIAYLQTRLLRAQLCSGREEEAKEDLRARNTTESAKLLTATYESEQKPDSAWLYLNQIPDDNAENTAFKDLYVQLLLGIEPPAGSGKTINTQEIYLHQTALQEQTPNAPIAQAINACFYGKTYYKNVIIQRDYPSSGAKNNKKLLSLFPNPASNNVSFRLSEANNLYWLMITDMYGKNIQVIRLSSTYSHFNTEYLPEGVFFCTLLKQNMEIVETHKLIVVH